MRLALGSLTMGVTALTALALSGCGDTIPPDSQGAVSYQISRPPPPEKSCGQSHSGNAPDLGKGQNITSTGVGEVAVDGQNGARIRCQVKPEGSSFSVAADLLLGDISFSLTTTVSPEDTEAEGTVRLQDNLTASPLSQPAYVDPPTQPCKIDVRSGRNYGVGPGWIWGHFVCDRILDERSPGGHCSAEGTFLFDNCDE